MTSLLTLLPDDPVGAVQAALADRYLVEGIAGIGATSHVLRAKDRRLGHDVAIKVLRPDVAAQYGQERFLREIGLAARLQHPHIVPIHDSGAAAGRLYYVMPFIEGQTLRERLDADGPLPFDETMRLVLEVADALGFAHSRGIVHRDVKPENILLFRGHAMTADFGIAKITDAAGSERLTHDGLGLGTPVYMSPEQALGGDDVDARADLYSLACVMFEMLEGEAPFTGRTLVELLARKASAAAPMLRRRSGDVPAHVQASLRCALDRDPAGRFETLAAFADALTRPGVPLPVRGKPRPTLARSIAVLPFSDRSATADGEFLGDGIAEDLIGALSRLEGVRVVARGSAFAFKGTERDPKDIAAELGVDAVLTGTVRRHGTRLRISADLVEGGTGYALWSDRYDRELTDVFDVQDEITRAILERLSAQLLGAGRRLIEAPTANIDAYQAYLRGRFEWNERTEAGLLRAVEHHSTAVLLDPGFALAHAGLADARLMLAVYGLRAPQELLTDAAHDADRALALIPDLAEALTARASVRAFRARDWAGAERDYLTALDSREAYATAHQWQAMHLLAPLGRFAEARVRLARARELDGLSPAIATSAGLLRYYERDHQQAVAEFDLVLASHARFGLAHLGRGLALSARGAHDEALGALERAHLLMGQSPETVAALGVALAAAGQPVAALERLGALDALSASQYVSPVLIAQVATALGDTARALAALDDAHASGAADLAMIGVRPVFDALRGIPRFEAIRRALQV